MPIKTIISALGIAVILLSSCINNTGTNPQEKNREPQHVQDHLIQAAIHNSINGFVVNNTDVVLLNENTTDMATVAVDLISDEVKNDKDNTVYHVTAQVWDENNNLLNATVIDVAAVDLVKNNHTWQPVKIITKNQPQKGQLRFVVNGVAQKNVLNFYIAKRTLKFEQDYVVTKQNQGGVFNLKYVSDLPGDNTGDFLNITLQLVASDNIILHPAPDDKYQFSHDLAAVNYEIKTYAVATTTKIQNHLKDQPERHIPETIKLAQNNTLFANDSQEQFEIYYCPTPRLYISNNIPGIAYFYTVTTNDVVKSKIMYCNLDDKVSTMHAAVKAYPDDNDYKQYLKVEPNDFNLIPNQPQYFSTTVIKSLWYRWYAMVALIAYDDKYFINHDLNELAVVGFFKDAVLDDKTVNRIWLDFGGGGPEEVARGHASNHSIMLTCPGGEQSICPQAFSVTLTSDCNDNELTITPKTQDVQTLETFKITISDKATVGRVCHVNIEPPADFKDYRPYPFFNPTITVTITA